MGQVLYGDLDRGVKSGKSDLLFGVVRWLVNTSVNLGVESGAEHPFC